MCFFLLVCSIIFQLINVLLGSLATAFFRSFVQLASFLRKASYVLLATAKMTVCPCYYNMITLCSFLHFTSLMESKICTGKKCTMSAEWSQYILNNNCVVSD